MYIGIAICGMASVNFCMPLFLAKIKKFEEDCVLWDADSGNIISILPPKVKALDDNRFEADRPERVLLSILYGLPKESVNRISPESLTLKTWNKLPLMIFTNLAAMSSSLS